MAELENQQATTELPGKPAPHGGAKGVAASSAHWA